MVTFESLYWLWMNFLKLVHHR